jgi:hypothetical protein
VDRYISEGWCFVVAHLHRDSGGSATPHPIVAAFPSSQPIYPMRLTGLSGSTTHVELYAVADVPLAAPDFRTELLDTFSVSAPQGANTLSTTEARQTGVRISSPDVVPLLWNGCTLTKLVADLPSTAMERDVVLTQAEAKPVRRHVYSPQGRKDVVTIIAIQGPIAAVIFGSWFLRGRRKPLRWETYTMAAILLAGPVVAGITWWVLPVVPVYDRPWSLRWHSHLIDRAIQDALDHGNLHAGMNPAEVTATLERWMSNDDRRSLLPASAPTTIVNHVTGEPITWQRSPGNLALRTIGSEVYLCLYDEDTRETRFLLPPAKSP